MGIILIIVIIAWTFNNYRKLSTQNIPANKLIIYTALSAIIVTTIFIVGTLGGDAILRLLNGLDLKSNTWIITIYGYLFSGLVYVLIPYFVLKLINSRIIKYETVANIK